MTALRAPWEPRSSTSRSTCRRRTSAPVRSVAWAGRCVNASRCAVPSRCVRPRRRAGCGLFEITKIGDEYWTYLVECKDPKAVTILLRGASKDILNEIERNLADAMSVVRTRCWPLSSQLFSLLPRFIIQSPFVSDRSAALLSGAQCCVRSARVARRRRHGNGHRPRHQHQGTLQPPALLSYCRPLLRVPI